MAPMTPHWTQPSHPDIQQVTIVDGKDFVSKSHSKISLPPLALYAKMTFPPCTMVAEPAYSTVQIGKDRHLDLNSDLLYINHSCEPSLIFDTASLRILAGPNGLQQGEELTFFYPSTEWAMAQPFDCLCSKPTCRGRISGAKDMTPDQLAGLWINGHIQDLLLEDRARGRQPNGGEGKKPPGREEDNGQVENSSSSEGPNGLARRGPTSRELSGEMGGDTTHIV